MRAPLLDQIGSSQALPLEMGHSGQTLKQAWRNQTHAARESRKYIPWVSVVAGRSLGTMHPESGEE